MMKKRIISTLMAALILLTLLPVQAWALTTSSYAPYAKIQYEYSSTVTGRTIRYISQIVGSSSFSWDYWPENNSLTYYGTPGRECGTACISMALSYIGINKTPYEILVPYDGQTMFDVWEGTEHNWTTIASGMDNYINGNGKYSPVVIRLDGAGADGDDHYIMLMGKVSDNVFQYISPDSESPNTTTISGSTATYKSTTYPIIEIHQWYNPSYSEDQDYLSQCTPYPSYVTIKITQATTIKSLPCSKKTDPNSTDIRNGVIGETLTATALYKNTAGNYWYKVSVDGKTGYVYAGDTTVNAQRNDDVTISGVSAPTQLSEGSTFSIKGDIRSTYNTIKKVNGYIYGAKEYSGSATVNGNYYSLYNSAVDYALYFNYLPTGYYNYSVEAECEHYYSTDGATLKTYSFTKTLVDQDFTVGNPSHTHSYSIIQADDNYHWMACSCGATTEKVEHTYGGWSIEKEPTCTESGLRSRKCPGCYHTMKEVIPATGHHFTTRKYDYAYHWDECSCGEIDNKEEHTYGEWITIEEATCTEGGRASRSCLKCGNQQGKETTKLGHEYDSGVVDENDRITYTCARCGDTYSESAFSYAAREDGTIAITDYDGINTDLTIPNEIDGNTVSAIGQNAFSEQPDITKIALPSSVTTIMYGAFNNCGSLKSVVMPEGLVTIEAQAFAHCSSLKEISIPASVTTIRGSAFLDCKSLSGLTVNWANENYESEGGTLYTKGKTTLHSIVSAAQGNYIVPDGVSIIGESAFSGYDEISNIVLPNGTTTIGPSAFQGCSGLTEIAIPASVTKIWHNAFANCDNLSDVYFSGTESDWDAIAISTLGNDVLKSATIHFNSVGDYTFSILDDGTIEITKYIGSDTDITIPTEINGRTVTKIAGSFRGAVSVTIPDSVTTLATNAFLENPTLVTVILGSGVREIGSEDFASAPFAGCTSLKGFVVSQENPYFIADEAGVLYSKDKKTLVHYPAGSTRTSYQIDPGTTKIFAGAFENCVNLAEVSIPDTVIEIGHHAFSACHGLTSVVVPGVSKIGWYAFGFCNNLTSVTLKEGVQTIFIRSFSECPNLRTITIPKSVTSIGVGAFDGCNSLADIYYGGTKEEWNTLPVGSANDVLTVATIHCSILSGDINGSGGSADASDMQCLYTYLTMGEMVGAYEEDETTFLLVADINSDGNIDVYDLQRLYEAVSSIRPF